jgi:histidine ammonia-lyase
MAPTQRSRSPDAGRGPALTLEDLSRWPARPAPCEPLSPPRARRWPARGAWWDEAVARGEVSLYRRETGFGSFADVVIPARPAGGVQLNPRAQHAAASRGAGRGGDAGSHGPAGERPGPRAYSGIRPETLDLLMAMINRRVHPVVPLAGGSVGASGDLAPLAHLVPGPGGRGTVRHRARDRDGARSRSRPPAWRPRLQAKEGLALIKRHAAHVGHGRLAWRRPLAHGPQARTSSRPSTTDGQKGTDVAFDPRIHAGPGPIPGRPLGAQPAQASWPGSAIRVVAPRLREGAGRLQPALHPAGLTAPSATRWASCAATVETS